MNRLNSERMKRFKQTRWPSNANETRLNSIHFKLEQSEFNPSQQIQCGCNELNPPVNPMDSNIENWIEVSIEAATAVASLLIGRSLAPLLRRPDVHQFHLIASIHRRISARFAAALPDFIVGLTAMSQSASSNPIPPHFVC